MPEAKEIEKLKSVKDFDALVEYLRDELYWPIEAEDAEDITFDYNPTELGIDKKHAAKIKTVKQIRPLADNQPWGLFYVEFEPKKLPVGVLRRILKALVHSRRRTDDRQKTWALPDLMFISALGEATERRMSFAHFSEAERGLPELKTFSWDASDTHLHYLQNTLDLEKLRWPENEKDAEAWREQWSSAFMLTHRYVIRTSRELAVKMAQLAAQIRDQVKSVYDYEIASGPLHKLFENFKKMLIYDLEVDTFADMYAQTIAYGLFSAKATHEGEFAIEDISAMIPNTNPFLKNLFEECTRIGETQRDCLDLEELGVTELVKMLKEVNIEAILQDFGRQKKGEDPVIHFYEDFLREYDPKQKVKRGIFYTPDSVVSFIVRSVDYLLRTEFDCPDGLADTSTIPVKVNEEVKQVPKVQILDPATGTGTFLKYVIEAIRKTFEGNHKDLSDEELRKEWNEYVDKNLLPRVFGFELLMAPYAIAHLKLGLKLKETGYEFSSHQRLGVALTNALESGTASAETLEPYLGWLAQESKYANYVKTAKNISVTIGNPPYSVSSLNKGPYIERLMNDYKEDVKEERNIQPLSDDYIKFIRFAHKRIRDNGFGIFAMITNNSYLSGVIHRGMRKKLLETFDKMYILNLHGSLRIGEKTPEGGKDENVFDIQQGVSIALYVKFEKTLKEKKVYYTDLWGQQNEKYNYLFENDVESVDWEKLKPKEPYYFFVPKDFALQVEYDKFWKVTDIFKVWSSGVKTHRDHFVVGFTKEEIVQRLKVFTGDLSDELVKERLKLKDTRDWKFKEAREKGKRENLEEKIYYYAYRAFNDRLICYELNLIERGCDRWNLMKHLLKENLTLITTRKISLHLPFSHVSVEDKIGDIRYIVDYEAQAYFFPLYLYPNESGRTLIDENASKPECTPNFTSNFMQAINEALGTEPTAEEIFYYLYAVLYSPTYRKRYEEFLKIDFPRVPSTSDRDLFKTLCRLGSELVSLHLMKSPELNNLITEFKGEGDNIVATIGKNSYKDGKLHINKTQYFEGIPEGVYNFYIGAYQVCRKWLKDRKGRELTEDEIEHYQKIVVALNETLRIMKEIDEVVEAHGGWPVQ